MIPSADLLHWWPGDGDAGDDAGAADGTVNGATFAAGRIGSAFSFDGVNDTVTFGSTAGNFGTADFTVLYWIRTPNTTRFEGVLGKREICAFHSFWDMRPNANGTVSVELSEDAGATDYNSIASLDPINDGAYHLFAAAREGATLRLFVDGVQAAEGTTTGVTSLSNTALLTAGRSACTGLDGTDFFSGQLDEIQIYDRALNACEILASVDAGLDVDLDGSIQPLTDILLLLRYVFGFRDATLVTGAVGAGCVRCAADPLEVFIASIEDQLDVDGDGSVAPLTDILLLLRYAFGFRGSTLVSGAVSGTCTRCDAPAIEGFLAPFFL